MGIERTGKESGHGSEVNTRATPTHERATITYLEHESELGVGELVFRPCRLGFGGRTRALLCAELAVPENPLNENGKTIDLFIARLPALKNNANKQDPVLFLAGGPGQAASQVFLFADKQFPELARTRDFYFVDQRGTGLSNALNCTGLNDIDGVYEAQIQDVVTQCLKNVDGDVRHYTTEYAIYDLEAVRKAIKIEKWNLFGVSYGTRMAMRYAELFTESVRSMVLDSVVPNQHVLGSNLGMQSQRALDRLFDECESQIDCAAQFPQLKAALQAFIARPDDNKNVMAYEDLANGVLTTHIFEKRDVLDFIRFSLYAADTRASLLTMLNEALVKNHYAPLIRAGNSIRKQLNEGVGLGLHYSVMCAEAFPFLKSARDSGRLDQGDYYLGSRVTDALLSVCSVWPSSRYTSESKKALKSDIPSLLLAGELDPITPPSYARLAAQSLKNAKVLTVPERAHAVSTFGCGPTLIGKFIDEASVKDLDSDCLHRLNRLPIYLNANGFLP